jgi:quercetin dioxygenase-like cupin family protein
VNDVSLTRDQIRSFIAAMEAEMYKHDQVEIETKHFFANGAYVRCILIPKGVLATGKRHRHSSIHLVLKGSMRILTEGGGVREVQAPDIFVSQPGNKMSGYAYEDTIWATAHATDKTDVAEIEAELVYNAEEEAKLFPVKPLERVE